MKKVILAVVMGISAMSFVSCGNTEVNEDNIKNKYKIIYTYSDFGLYAGCWILLIFYTYSIYMSMGKFFLTAPIIAYLLYLLIKKIKEWKGVALVTPFFELKFLLKSVRFSAKWRDDR